MTETKKTTERKKLPIGVQTFSKIREGGFYYVDKTGFAMDLIEKGSYYFLSRPRRFGKSLFVDTLKAIFECRRELFTGLKAESRWDWEVSYPVLTYSFGGGVFESVESVQNSLKEQLAYYEEFWKLEVAFPEIRSRFKRLIRHVAEKSGRPVVILVDEYDKPILDRIEDRDEALRIRETLKDFYSVIKDSDAHLRFAFLTGVSKFSKAGIFSGLNNLEDITLDQRYSEICGYTEADVNTVFGSELEGLDREEIRRWYDGYNWLGESVYNPFDILLLFAKRRFSAYWFETGTPAFLVKLLAEKGVFTPELDKTMASEMLISTFDVDSMPVEALLFQAGYLTIGKVEDVLGSTFFHLCYPNHEVYQSLNTCLAAAFLGDSSREMKLRMDLLQVLRSKNFSKLKEHFMTLFAAIPHDWFRKNPIARYEGYYASVFYSHFAALGLDIRMEDATNHGRIDMVVFFEGQVLIFEFKVVELVPEKKALEQLLSRGYADKYGSRGEPVHLIGVEFSREQRNLIGFDYLPPSSNLDFAHT